MYYYHWFVYLTWLTRVDSLLIIGTKSFAISIQKEAKVFKVNYTLNPENLRGPSLRYPNAIKQQYFLEIVLKTPFFGSQLSTRVPIFVLGTLSA